MIKIEYANFKHRYKILWLRYVYGVDLNNHCMKSLLGHNDSRVRGYMPLLPPLELEEARFYYLCGVDENFIWANNLHLAFVYSQGNVIDLDNEFIRCRILNARRLPINDKYIDWNHPKASNKLFHTCRNWQFAWMLAKQFDVPQTPTQRSLFD